VKLQCVDAPPDGVGSPEGWHRLTASVRLRDGTA